MELDEARAQLKKLHDAKKEEKKKTLDEDASKRIKHLEEQCAQLQKQVRLPTGYFVEEGLMRLLHPSHAGGQPQARGGGTAVRDGGHGSSI